MKPVTPSNWNLFTNHYKETVRKYHSCLGDQELDAFGQQIQLLWNQVYYVELEFEENEAGKHQTVWNPMTTMEKEPKKKSEKGTSEI